MKAAGLVDALGELVRLGRVSSLGRFVDGAERLARGRAKELFGAEHANVQPHSGSQANMAVYFAVLEPGDTMLGMDLTHGGHLTHGHPLNQSGKQYEVVAYGVRKDTETIDYDRLREVCELTNQCTEIFLEISDMKRQVPNPVPNYYNLNHLAQKLMLVGTPDALDFYKTALEVCTERMEKGLHVLPEEKIRFMMPLVTAAPSASQ